MAEIRIHDEDATPRSATRPGENLAGAEPLPAGHALPGGAEPARAAMTDDPEVVRAEIEQTRARMSETIDEIEEALVRKKEQIQDRLDFTAPIRERPLMAAGVAFGVGLLLGLLTGGGDEEDERETRLRGGTYLRDDGDSPWRHRADLWESRARRLLRVAREQEDKIQDLRERYGELYAHEMDEELAFDDLDEPLEHRSGGLRSTLRDGISDVLGRTLHELVGGRR